MHHTPRARMTAMLLVGLATSASAKDLAPNRALYVFEPARVSQNGQAYPIDGRIAYELTGNACKGYEVDSRVSNIYAGDNNQKRVDLDAATFESGDGNSFEVRQTQSLNQTPGIEEHIKAERNSDGSAAGTIHGSKQSTFKLNPDVLFPTAFEKRLIAKALQGETRDVSYIFDGSEGDKVFRAVTLIGPKQAPGTNAQDKANAVAAPLSTETSWHFAVSYYPAVDDNSEMPSYQTDFTLYENGVSTNLIIDYGAYALKGTLAKFELLPEEPCVPGQKPQASTGGDMQ